MAGLNYKRMRVNRRDYRGERRDRAAGEKRQSGGRKEGAHLDQVLHVEEVCVTLFASHRRHALASAARFHVQSLCGGGMCTQEASVRRSIPAIPVFRVSFHVPCAVLPRVRACSCVGTRGEGAAGRRARGGGGGTSTRAARSWRFLAALAASRSLGSVMPSVTSSYSVPNDDTSVCPRSITP
jgi:hypothetical protein